MESQRILFDVDSGYVLLCLAVGSGYAYLLYSVGSQWSKTVNRILFAARAIVVFFIAFLLMGPTIKLIQNYVEQPLFVVLHDDSQSITEGTSKEVLAQISARTEALSDQLRDDGFEVERLSLSGEPPDSIQYAGPTSDISEALRRVSNRFEGRRIEGVLLVSDGIYNTGVSPLYASYNFPIHTLAIGDTTIRKDIAIKSVQFNRIAYLGNQFPIRVEVVSNGFNGESLNVSLRSGGKLMETLTKQVNHDGLVLFDFHTKAETEGIQRFDVVVESKDADSNKQNNRSTIFVEVVEGKKKIVLVAAAPHPDIKAIRSVIEKNENYEFILQLYGQGKQAPGSGFPEKIDVAILYQVPDVSGRTATLVSQVLARSSSTLFVLGRQVDLRRLPSLGAPLVVTSISRDMDNVTPLLNSSFNKFTLDEDLGSTIVEYPPLSVPFGKFSVPLTASAILQQRIGSVSTEKPLLAVTDQANTKSAILMGEGIWKWRMDEYSRTEDTRYFDELFGKLLQYLGTSDDKSKFRSYTLKQEFSESEPVVIESQVYNDIFEPIYGNTIDIDLIDERGTKTRYQYVLSPGNLRYQIGGLKEGVYRFTSKTQLQGEWQTVNGQFVVAAKVIELQNLNADYGLLQKLSERTGGKFYTASNLYGINDLTGQSDATGIIHSEETFNPMIHLKWLFFTLLGLVTMEWFIRKYLGSY